MRAGGKINHGYDARLVFNEWLEAGYKPEWITEVVEMAKAVKVYNLYKPNSISLLMEAHSRSHPLSKEVSKEVSKEGKK
jgi:hypothetical protein